MQYVQRTIERAVKQRSAQAHVPNAQSRQTSECNYGRRKNWHGIATDIKFVKGGKKAQRSER
jgi:hypothetical protein